MIIPTGKLYYWFCELEFSPQFSGIGTALSLVRQTIFWGFWKRHDSIEDHLRLRILQELYNLKIFFVCFSLVMVLMCLALSVFSTIPEFEEQATLTLYYTVSLDEKLREHYNVHFLP